MFCNKKRKKLNGWKSVLFIFVFIGIASLYNFAKASNSGINFNIKQKQESPFLKVEILAKKYKEEVSVLDGSTGSSLLVQKEVSKYEKLYTDNFSEIKSEWTKLFGYWTEGLEKKTWINNGVLELDNCTRGICVLESAGELKDYEQEYKLIIPKLYEIKNEISVPLRIDSKYSFYEVLITETGKAGIYKRINKWKHEKLAEKVLNKIEQGHEYIIKVRADGKKLSFKIWNVQNIEPETWNLEVEDKERLSKAILTGKAGIGSYNKGLQIDDLVIYTKIGLNGSQGLGTIIPNEKIKLNGNLILDKAEKELVVGETILENLSVLLQVIVICFFSLIIMFLFQVKAFIKFERKKGYLLYFSKIIKGKIAKSKKSLLKPYLQSMLLVTVLFLVLVLGYGVVSFKAKSTSKVLIYASENSLQANSEIKKGEKIEYIINYSNNGEEVLNNIILKNIMPGNGYQFGSLLIDDKDALGKKVENIIKDEDGRYVIKFLIPTLTPDKEHKIRYVYEFGEEDVLGNQTNSIIIKDQNNLSLEKGFNLNLVSNNIILKDKQ